MSQENDIKKGLESVIGGILEIADRERHESKPYKDLFTRTNAKPLPIILSEIEHDMTAIVLNAYDILEKNGYKVNNEVYKFLLALPISSHLLRKDIESKDGWVCCEDKKHHILHKYFKKLLK